MAFVLRLKICGISFVLESFSPGTRARGIYQIKERPPVARRPFENTENAALFRAAGRLAAAASAAARGARGRGGDGADGGHENEQQREQGLLHEISPRSFRSGVFGNSKIRIFLEVKKKKENDRQMACRLSSEESR
jgi:hypothetical protein